MNYQERMDCHSRFSPNTSAPAPPVVSGDSSQSPI